jgi:hypothetical protein
MDSQYPRHSSHHPSLCSPVLDVALTVWVVLKVWCTIERRPLWRILEESHSLDVLKCPSVFSAVNAHQPRATHVVTIGSETMKDPRRQDDQIILLQPNSHPLILGISNIKESVPIKYIPDFFILVQVLVEKHLYFLLVDDAHFVGGDGDFISILVGALLSDIVDGRDTGAAMVEDTELGEVRGRYFAAGIMVKTLIALSVGVSWVGWSGKRGDEEGLLQHRRNSRLS